MVEDAPKLLFEKSDEFEKWMEKHHDKVDSVWLKFAKKASGLKSISYDEALDVALCFGWIDGIVNKHDDDFYLQRFTPRRSRSVWSKRNTEHIQRLIKEGRMRPSGLAEVEKAKKDGRWDSAYHPPSTAVLPESFVQLLKKNKKAKEFYEKLNNSNKYAIIYRLTTPKKEETKKVWEERIVKMLENQEKFH